jgi:N-acetylneuraminic acid mutarotase
MRKQRTAQSAFFNLRALVGLLVSGAAACSMSSGALLAFFHSEALSTASHKTLTFADRVAYQRAIEGVYWRHRIWPKERPDPKLPLDAVMSQAQLEKKVADYLRDSQALEHSQRLITADQLQAEIDRMAQHTKQPETLRELFEALGNDPFVIAECLARPILADRLRASSAVVAGVSPAQRNSFVAGTAASTRNHIGVASNVDNARYKLPQISIPLDCWDDTWTATAAPFEIRESHTAVWTGSEMIVWGGIPGEGRCLNTGGKYNPATDTWTATSTTAAPEARLHHTAMWTGSEMIVWGGSDSPDSPDTQYFNTGGRYNPITDSWTATNITDAPAGRAHHTAVWTGGEMMVWGGQGSNTLFNTGGRYNPGTDSWTATSTTNAPTPRVFHSAVWTGSEMIVWGGTNSAGGFFTGGRYNPNTDSWTATSDFNAPEGRYDHTAVWTGSEMIIWGGEQCSVPSFSTGGRYNPITDSWTATSVTNAPAGRGTHTTVWTGSEMIIWGGLGRGGDFNTGGRYNSATDSWTSTGANNAPPVRRDHTAVWTGSEMIVWGGIDRLFNILNGARYNPATDSWNAMSIPDATVGRVGHTAMWSDSEMIVWGGYGGGNTHHQGDDAVVAKGAMRRGLR